MLAQRLVPRAGAGVRGSSTSLRPSDSGSQSSTRLPATTWSGASAPGAIRNGYLDACWPGAGPRAGNAGAGNAGAGTGPAVGTGPGRYPGPGGLGGRPGPA